MGNGGASEALTYARKGVAVNPKVLRQYAVDCDRMAKECSDLFTKEALIELVVEFQRAAEEIESGSRARGRRKQGAQVQRSPGSRSADQASRCNAQRTPFFVGALIPAQS
jgi:hypothetical protein